MSTYDSPPPAAASPVNATLILVLGILSIFVCGLLGPVAWVMGNNALRTLDAGMGDVSQRGTVNAGRICGIVGTALLVLGTIMWFVFGAAIFGAAREGARQQNQISTPAAP